MCAQGRRRSFNVAALALLARLAGGARRPGEHLFVDPGLVALAADAAVTHTPPTALFIS
jgi:hypothetical protein